MRKRGVYYKLEGKAYVSCTPEEAEELLRNPIGRIIDRTDIVDDIYVSTVFMAIDHSREDEGPPVLFETMVFGGELDGMMNRYTSYEAAEDGHQEIVTKVKKTLL